MCVDGDFGKDTLSGNVGKGHMEGIMQASCVGVVGEQAKMGVRTAGLLSLLSSFWADLSKVFPHSVSLLAHLGLQNPKLFKFSGKLRFWDSLDFALNPVIMTLVSPEPLL